MHIITAHIEKTNEENLNIKQLFGCTFDTNFCCYCCCCCCFIRFRERREEKWKERNAFNEKHVCGCGCIVVEHGSKPIR